MRSAGTLPSMQSRFCQLVSEELQFLRQACCLEDWHDSLLNVDLRTRRSSGGCNTRRKLARRSSQLLSLLPSDGEAPCCIRRRSRGTTK